MPHRKGRWSVIKKLEFSTLCVLAGWLLATLALWWTPLLEKHRAEVIFSLFFFVIIYIVLGAVRKMPKFRLVPDYYSEDGADRLIRLRILWLAEMRLIFAGGFAGTALSLPFSNALRRAVSGLFLLVLVTSVISFVLRWRALSKVERQKPRVEVPEQEEE